MKPEELGALFFVTVTGVASPSIDAKLVNRMKLSRNIKRIPIFGLGCVAGAAAVSYTHLDVYKRQSPGRLAAAVRTSNGTFRAGRSSSGRPSIRG